MLLLDQSYSDWINHTDIQLFSYFHLFESIYYSSNTCVFLSRFHQLQRELFVGWANQAQKFVHYPTRSYSTTRLWGHYPTLPYSKLKTTTRWGLTIGGWDHSKRKDLGILDQWMSNVCHQCNCVIFSTKKYPVISQFETNSSQFDTRYFAFWNKYISPFWTNTFVNRRQIHFAIPDKYTSQFETNSLQCGTTTFHNWRKYISQFQKSTFVNLSLVWSGDRWWQSMTHILCCAKISWSNKKMQILRGK